MSYVEPAEIERVKHIDLLSYLQQYEPDELIKAGTNSYTTRTHDSLKLSHGCWYWWSQGIGGVSALDYLIKVRNMTFLDAVGLLGAREIELPKEHTQPTPTVLREKKLVLPPPAQTNRAAMNYLRSRGIAFRIISQCMNNGLIYTSERGNNTNVVFVGKDEGGVPRYAALRGVAGDYKGEAVGSDKRFAFRMYSHDRTDEVHVFEGAIDVLSFATLAFDAREDWRNLNLLSLGGIPPVRNDRGQLLVPQALNQYLMDNPQTKRVCLHMDNDQPGIVAARAIASAVHKRGYDFEVAPPEMGKDVNESLMMRYRVKGRSDQSRSR